MYLVIAVQVEFGVVVTNHETTSDDPQTVANLVREELGGNDPERIMLVKNGEHPDKGCHDEVAPEVVASWELGDEYNF